jgi:ABC-type lipoprotein release transport system permease subunit
MSSPIFLEIHDVKALSGYGHHDLAGIHVMVNNPQKTAKLIANRLHDELIPGLAMIDGNVQFKNKAIQAAVLGFRTDSASLRYITPHVKLLSGDSAKTFGYAGVILSTKLAQQLGAKPFDTLRTIWKGKYDSLGANGGTMKIIVTGIADSAAPIPVVSLLINEKDFYKGYYMPLPAIPGKEMFATMPDSTNPLWKGLAPEFVLMKRCATTQEVTKLTREMSRAKYKGMMVNVQSMYETASAILNVEFALNLITVAAGMILFFIILIGVINTLRMTIKERTREIGTVRAIGMQKSDVRSMFLLETAFLAVIASTIGACVGFATMFGLSQLTINAGDNPMGMLLVDGHLFFAPTVIATLAYIGFIVILAVFTAYFPAKRAANMQASDALRHYE